MTVVVAVEGPNRETVLAWDDRYVETESATYTSGGFPKGWEVAYPSVVMACAGDLAAIQALKYEWAPGHPPEAFREREILQAWLWEQVQTYWKEVLQPWAPEHGSLWPVTAIVLVGGWIFVVGDDFSVTRPSGGYAAVGSGRNWAEGYLYCGAAWDNLTAYEMAQNAIACAAAHTYQVGGVDGVIRVTRGLSEPLGSEP